MPTAAPHTDRILRRPEVQARAGLGRSALYAMIRRGEFPAPVRLTGSAVGWRESDVAAWIDSRPTADDGEGAA